MFLSFKKKIQLKPKHSNRNQISITEVVVVIVVFLGAVFYLLFLTADRSSFLDVLVGTFVAATIGVLTAIYLERKRKEKNSFAEYVNNRYKEKQVITNLYSELQFNLSLLNNNRSITSLNPFKLSSWEATSNSGQLMYITEYSLLFSLGNVYYWVKTIVDLETDALKSYSLGNAPLDQTSVWSALFNRARQHDRELLKALNNTIDEIKKRLEILDSFLSSEGRHIQY